MCPDGTYQDAATHQNAACTEQPKCGPGQQYVDLGKKTTAKCEACTAGKYQNKGNHRDACIAHAECVGDADQYTAVQATPTTNRICGTSAECTEYQYEAQPHTSTTERQCGQRTSCTLGEYVTADPTPTTDRTCNDCDGKVEYSGKMNSDSCVPLDTCGKGEYVGVLGSRVKQLECRACPGGQSQSLSGRRPESCFQQPRCAKGERLANADATTQGFCDMCGVGQYIEEDDHRSANCVQQPFCNENEYLTGAGISSKGTCTECPPGTEMAERNHRALECTLIIQDFNNTDVKAGSDPDATPPPGWVDPYAADGGGGGGNGDGTTTVPATTLVLGGDGPNINASSGADDPANGSLSTWVLVGIIGAAVVLVLAIVTLCVCLHTSTSTDDATFQPDRSRQPSARHQQPGVPQHACGETTHNPTYAGMPPDSPAYPEIVVQPMYEPADPNRAVIYDKGRLAGARNHAIRDKRLAQQLDNPYNYNSQI